MMSAGVNLRLTRVPRACEGYRCLAPAGWIDPDFLFSYRLKLAGRTVLARVGMR
jgi:hypothetical protein